MLKRMPLRPLSRKSLDVRIFLAIAITMTLAGCVQLIPYQAKLRLEIPDSEKKADEMVIRMSQELRSLDVVVKPVNMPLTNSYKFEIGKSLEGSLSKAMQDLFPKTSVSSLPINDLPAAAYILETELVDYKIKIGVTIFSPHSVQLSMRYAFSRGGEPLFKLETQTEGDSSMSKGEKWGHVINPFEKLGAASYRGSIGRAYDNALGESIDALVKKILEVVQ